jgi:hypothetical protein
MDQAEALSASAGWPVDPLPTSVLTATKSVLASQTRRCRCPRDVAVRTWPVDKSRRPNASVLVVILGGAGEAGTPGGAGCGGPD